MSPIKAVIMILSVKIIQVVQDGVYFKIEENTFVSHENAIWSGKAASLLSCSLMCASADIMTESGACLSYSETMTRNINKMLPQEGSFYVEKVNFLNKLKLHKIYTNQQLMLKLRN